MATTRMVMPERRRKKNAEISRIAGTIHNGMVTYHHDQSIAPHSFRVMKTMARRPGKPIATGPVELLLSLMLGCLSFGLLFGVVAVHALKLDHAAVWSGADLPWCVAIR